MKIDSEKISGEEHAFSAGFGFAVVSDGSGVGVGPHTGERTTVNTTHNFEANELGHDG